MFNLTIGKIAPDGLGLVVQKKGKTALTEDLSLNCGNKKSKFWRADNYMEYRSGVISPVESISQGWSIIKDNYGMYVLMVLVLVIIEIVVSLIVSGIGELITGAILGVIGYSATDLENIKDFSQVLVPQIVSLIPAFFVSIIVITIAGALSCGYYNALSRTSSTGQFDFGDLFSGFGKLTECLIVGVVLSVIGTIIQAIFLGLGAAIGFSFYNLKDILIQNGELNTGAISGLMGVILMFAGISLLIQLIIFALTAFVYPLIADRNASGGNALSLSIKGGLANFVGMVLFGILLGLMMFGGAMLCGIGLLFVAPLIWASIFAAFQSIFGKKTDTYNQEPPPPPDFGYQQGY